MASLRVGQAGQASIAGVVDFTSVPALWAELARLIDRNAALSVSLGEVTSSNSAALALLLEASEYAAARQHTLVFTGLPQGLVDLANLSNVMSLLEP